MRRNPRRIFRIREESPALSNAFSYLKALFADPKTSFLLLAAGAVFLLLLTVLLLRWRVLLRASRRRRVKAKSTRLKMLRELNSFYAFCPVPENMYVLYEAPTKNKFLRFDYDGAYASFVAENADELSERVALTSQNEREYEAYLSEVRALPTHRRADDAALARLKEKTFCRIEDALLEENLLEPPKTGEQVRVICSYDTPAGRRHYEDERVYGADEILSAVEKARASLESEPLEEEDEAERARRERALMTASLRYDILKRDGFRCVLCGRGAADGVKLEVDHVKPVSRGGKTVPGNLRTLCFDCNRGKGASLEEAPNET